MQVEFTLVYLIYAIAATGVIVTLIVFYFARILRRRETAPVHGQQRQTSPLRDQLLDGRYRMGYELGRGMNAVTHPVQDPQHPQAHLVAKVLLTPEEEPRITPASYRRHLARFRREMKHLEQLQGSKFVVPVDSFHPNAIPPFFVMTRCSGSLEEELGNVPLPVQRVLDVAVDVCQGLIAIHQHEIIHRDLKPANILRHENRWVLADFGMSLLGGQGSTVSVLDSLPGTIPYTAPEVMYYESRAIRSTADVFSLGVTLKVMLTGINTWEGPVSSFLQARIDRTTRREIALFDTLIAEMTRFQPEDRPANIGVIARRLEEIFQRIDGTRGAGRCRGKSKRSRLQGLERFRQMRNLTS